jgi:hypothetical protein
MWKCVVCKCQNLTQYKQCSSCSCLKSLSVAVSSAADSSKMWYCQYCFLEHGPAIEQCAGCLLSREFAEQKKNRNLTWKQNEFYQPPSNNNNLVDEDIELVKALSMSENNAAQKKIKDDSTSTTTTAATTATTTTTIPTNTTPSMKKSATTTNLIDVDNKNNNNNNNNNNSNNNNNNNKPKLLRQLTPINTKKSNDATHISSVFNEEEDLQLAKTLSLSLTGKTMPESGSGSGSVKSSHIKTNAYNPVMVQKYKERMKVIMGSKTNLYGRHNPPSTYQCLWSGCQTILTDDLALVHLHEHISKQKCVILSQQQQPNVH